MAGVLGLGTVLAACGDSDDADSGIGDPKIDDDFSVLIVGAGAAGMAAGHLLAQRGVDFRILEAGPTYGGRIKHNTDWTEFPISLGAEWIHVAPQILTDIVNDESVEITTELAAYDPNDLGGFYDGQLLTTPLGDAPDLKFVTSSWLDFFETYVLPSVESRMQFDTQIVEIDHTASRVVLQDASGNSHEADAVIVTAPLKILQRGDITFEPSLPDAHLDAIAEAKVWSGLKAFVEFDEKFYPAYLGFRDSETAEGQRIYYDAAYGQTADVNVLGLFAVGAQAEAYQAYDEDELIQVILTELDEIYDSAATRTYRRHLVQNWNAEPFHGGAYLEDDAPSWISRDLAQSVGDRLYFAGSAYTQDDDWSSVHMAARSARDAVDELLS